MDFVLPTWNFIIDNRFIICRAIKGWWNWRVSKIILISPAEIQRRKAIKALRRILK